MNPTARVMTPTPRHSFVVAHPLHPIDTFTAPIQPVATNQRDNFGGRVRLLKASKAPHLRKQTHKQTSKQNKQEIEE